MRQRDLLVVGELNVDLILNQISGLPEIGEEKLAQKMDLVLGSSSAIFASNIATLGVGTAFCGMVGKDDFGRFVVKCLEDNDIDTKFVLVHPDEKTGLTVAMNYDQDRANVTYCGAMELLSIQEVPWKEIRQFRHVHLSNYFLQKGMKQDIVTLFKQAKANGLSTSLDLQVDPDGDWDFDYRSCLPYVDVFLPNESELLGLTDSPDIETGIQKLQNYANIIALKMGQKGAMVFHKGERLQADVYLHDHFVDAIGAGDSFNAGFLYRYLQGAGLLDCLQYGNLMGALNTTAAGGTGAFQSMTDLSRKAKELFDLKITD